MTIEFECPHCGLVIEAPDRTAGRKASCPGCGAPVTVPAASAAPRRSARPPRTARRSSRRRRRPDEYDSEPGGRPSRRRRRPDSYDDLPPGAEDEGFADEGPNYLLIGGAAGAVLLLIIILLLIMRTSGTSSSPVSGTQGPAAAVSLSPSPTPTPTPAVDTAALMAALSSIASTPLSVRDALIRRKAAVLFGAGKASIGALVENGVGSDNPDIRYVADYLLAALTGRKSKEDLLYEEDETKVEEGRAWWRDWWNDVKDSPLEDIVRPGVDPGNTKRAVLALALGFFRDRGTVPFLFDLMEDPDTEVRAAAYESVVRLLKNDRFGYDPSASLPIITETVKKYREWWDSVKAAYDFSRPEDFLPPPPAAEPPAPPPDAG